LHMENWVPSTSKKFIARLGNMNLNFYARCLLASVCHLRFLHQFGSKRAEILHIDSSYRSQAKLSPKKPLYLSPQTKFQNLIGSHVGIGSRIFCPMQVRQYQFAQWTSSPNEVRLGGNMPRRVRKGEMCVGGDWLG